MIEGTATPSGHVIVAVDGSPAADNAVDWAADEAALRGTELEVLHAWEWKAYEASDWYGHHLYNVSSEVVHKASERARRRRPELKVTTTVEHGPAEEVVTTASGRAGLMVTGSRGLGGFAGLLLGSVSRAVAAEGRCPLLVVRSGTDGTAEPPVDEDFLRPDGRPVLVGVSDETCRPAVEAALVEAVDRHRPLRALYAWSFPDMPVLAAVPVGPSSEAVRTCQRNGETILSQTLAPVLERYEDQYKGVEVTPDVVNAPRATAMVDASETASLVVIATRRRPGRVGRHLGPVTHALLHHSHAPVLLIPVGA
ncbi:universal stress protein [Yinghuangia seranimata]|uniref:universal stress protein n=1 Tax=Yinghuangia seranimata TaxID=408067 RepID=UPI00248B11D8|nr:universal stress protein [Yinghuangia seranimata]MDI2125453.1 universal stress protein [Yinghuangia seranimata]